jgi:predicted RNase H-related nuclease YkuK (DUF458 family)
MYKKQIDISQIVDFLETCSSDTKVYIGCDSERLQAGGVWWADYITAVVIHVNGNNGCKIFGAVSRERDYEQRVDKPRMRLMAEVYRVAELYLELSQQVAHDIEVHLDVNPNEMHNSSIVINEAVGYIRGMCGVIPFTKPDAWAASYAADRFKRLVEYQRQQVATPT